MRALRPFLSQEQCSTLFIKEVPVKGGTKEGRTVMTSQHATATRRNLVTGGAFMAAAAFVALLLGACADGGNGTAAGGGPTEVGIRLQEWAVVPARASAPAGEISFRIENLGQETHEFVVIRTDLSALDLPTEDNGSLSEAGEGLEVVDEVEGIPSSEISELTVSLEAGHYVLVCNIESHFVQGMSVDFEVE